MILSGYTMGPIDTIWPILFVIAITLVFYFFKVQIQATHWRKTIPVILLLVMLTVDGNYLREIASIPFGTVKEAFEGLPLHLCSSSAVMVMLYLGFKKEIFLDLLILQGFIGSIVTFAFPSISSSPAEFGYWTFFLGHAVLFITPAFFMIIEGKRLEKKHLVWGLIFIHILSYTNVIINETFGTDYMYLNSDNTRNLYHFIPLHQSIPAIDNLVGVLLFGEIMAFTAYFGTYFFIKFLQGDFKKVA